MAERPNPLPLTPPETPRQIRAYARNSSSRMIDGLRETPLGRGARGIMRDLVRKHYEKEGKKPEEITTLFTELGISIKDPSKQDDPNRDFAREGMEKAIKTINVPELSPKLVEIYMDEYLPTDPASVVVMLTDANVAELPLFGEGPFTVGYNYNKETKKDEPIIEYRKYDRNREVFLDKNFEDVEIAQDKWRIANALVSTRLVDGKQVSGRERIVPEDHESPEDRESNYQKWVAREKETFVEYAEDILQANLDNVGGDELADSRLKFIFNRMKRRFHNGFQGDDLSPLAQRVARQVIVRDVETGNADDAVDHAVDAGMPEEFRIKLEADPANAGELFDKWRQQIDEPRENAPQILFSHPD